MDDRPSSLIGFEATNPVRARDLARHEATILDWRPAPADGHSGTESGPKLVRDVPFQRLFDIVLSALLLLLLLPVFVLIAVAIKLDSPGPVLFVQKRIGRNGVPFAMFKYRSMRVDAETLRSALECQNERGAIVFKIRDDPRITRVGKLIRKLSLDEFPQILNVMRGDMSMVGPRPALPSEVTEYSDRARGRLSAMPGLTGLWQVSGRAKLTFDESIDLDLQYIERQSIGLYWRIILRTLPAVIKGNGAY